MKNRRIEVHLEEKVGLPKFSNVTYGASISGELEDGEDEATAIAEAEATVEGWMKDYFRREVEPMLAAAGD